MTPTASAPRSPAAEPTHPCARCGRPVGLSVGLCDECNPLGLRDTAAGQVHGSVFIAVTTAVVILFVLARWSIAGGGPYPATVDSVTPTEAGLAVTLTVTNDGPAEGQTSCRISRLGDSGTGTAAFVTSPRLASHETKTFRAVVTGFGSTPTDLQVECRTP